MSQYLSKSPKDCSKKESLININHKHYKKFFCAFSTLFTSLLSFILLIYLLLHPSKPQFALRETNIYQLNLISNSHLLNSSIQLTLLSKNPNQKVGIYYDQLQVYASYKGQQITSVDSYLPPFYQEHDESNVLTAALVGNGLPVAASLVYEVERDQTVGRMVLNVKMMGKLRWKVGTWVSGKYRFNVNCVAVMAFGPNTIPTVPLTSKQGSQCSTEL